MLTAVAFGCHCRYLLSYSYELTKNIGSFLAYAVSGRAVRSYIGKTAVGNVYGGFDDFLLSSILETYGVTVQQHRAARCPLHSGMVKWT